MKVFVLLAVILSSTFCSCSRDPKVKIEGVGDDSAWMTPEEARRFAEQCATNAYPTARLVEERGEGRVFTYLVTTNETSPAMSLEVDRMLEKAAFERADNPPTHTFKTIFHPAGRLTASQLDDVVALAHECGIADIGTVATLGYGQRASWVEVTSAEKKEDRLITYQRLTLSLGPPVNGGWLGTNPIVRGDFQLLEKHPTQKYLWCEERDERFKVRLEGDIETETADKIVTAFSEGRVRDSGSTHGAHSLAANHTEMLKEVVLWKPELLHYKSSLNRFQAVYTIDSTCRRRVEFSLVGGDLIIHAVWDLVS